MDSVKFFFFLFLVLFLLCAFPVSLSGYVSLVTASTHDMNNSNINSTISSPSSSLSVKPQVSSGACSSGSHENFTKKKRSKRIQIGGDLKNSVTFLKPKSGTKKSFFSNSAPNNIIRPTCSECGKKFSSWKALFGHMRCHPERQWRGMRPPSNFQRPENHPVQQQQQQQQHRDHDHDRSKFTKEDQEMATCLIMLANGSSSYKQPVMMDRRMLGSGESYGNSNHGYDCSSFMEVLDLNLPASPVGNTSEGDHQTSCSGCSSLDHALDLKLGL